ncbi:hypothetical protein L6164_033163 [Bauhinia variegata]|uniref:Uncharacterized protein n=1 Tax=Bauhinia variegata TaxID=167791 RepID=A0ACB9KR16_BAUVA|nr:hypothetical protein L6164_033163 [Bauhinia variegata]
MPFPWKKNRVKSISQIITGLPSPKHGGSLVVETGFPTSLVDLFVKNKVRFRKPKTKKRFQVEVSDPLWETQAAGLTPRPPSPLETSNLSDRTLFAEGPVLRRRVGQDVDWDEEVAVSGQGCDPVRESDGGSDSNMVIAAVSKMSVVVVLTLSMNKLAVGITMSALVLLFLEFIGKWAFCWLKPCPNANKNLKSLAQSVSNSIWVQNLMAFKQGKSSDSESSVSPSVDEEEHLVLRVESSYSPTSIEEIETERENEKGIPIPREEIQPAELDPIREEQIKLTIMEILEKECDYRRGNDDYKRSGKLKSKLVKKLVPKKLRRSNREKKIKLREEESSLSNSEISSTTEESVSSRRSEIEEEHENGNGPPVLLLRKRLKCVEDDESDNGISCSSESPLLKGEKRVHRVGNSNSGYVVLFLIVLGGLVVGRFLALLLTVAWIFMLKIVKNGGMSVNLPLVRSSVPISGKVGRTFDDV